MPCPSEVRKTVFDEPEDVCRNTDCDYSSAYVSLYTDSDLVGHGMTFTIGRGNDIVCTAIKEVASRLVGKEIEPLFANMGKAWEYLVADPQLRWYVSLVVRRS